MQSILLHGGRVIDPANEIDQTCDVLVRDGRIAAVGPLLDTPVAAGAERIDCTGRLVLPGLIDTHSHVYQYVTGRFGLNADMCGVHSGVTTLVDQGGASCMTLPGFRKFVIEPSRSRVLSFISAYLVGGLEGHFYPELYRPECADVEATVKAALANADVVKGIKAHAELGGFARWGVEVMEKAAAIGEKTGLPVYIHFGQLWPMPEEGQDVDPDAILGDVVKLLKPGDVLAHPFSRHPGGFVRQDGEVHSLVSEAVAMGLKVDVGHGSHFSYKMASKVLAAGIVPNTLGSDMHGYNTPSIPAPAGTPDEHPDEEHLFSGTSRFSLVSAMSGMMALGLTLEQVVPMVTTHAAKMVGMSDEIGTLGVGRIADVSVLSDQTGRWLLRDNEGTEVIAERMLQPVFCLREGVRFDAVAPILPVPQVA